MRPRSICRSEAQRKDFTFTGDAGRRKGLLHLLSGFVLILLSFADLAGQSSSRDSLSVDFRGIEPAQALEQISLQSTYHFTYDSDLLRSSGKVDLKLEDQDLGSLLDTLLAGRQLEWKRIRSNIVIYRSSPPDREPETGSGSQWILKGSVRDAENGKPLAYATISLADSHLGTITNTEGTFRILLPPDLPDPFLVVSYMGYRNRILPPDSLRSQQLEIFLDRDPLSIQEVIIRYTEPRNLLLQALRHVGQNYLEQPSAMTAFYRESVRKEERCMSHSEAVLEIAKRPYNSHYGKDQVSIRKKRSIENVDTNDTLWVKLRSGIQTSISLDVISNRPEFLDPEFLHLYDLSYEGVSQYDGKLVYIIGFKPAEQMTEVGFVGQVYIEFSSLSIIAVDFSYDPERIDETSSFFVSSARSRIRVLPLHARYHVEYREVDEGWHLSQIRADVALRARKKRRWIRQAFNLRIEMAVTDLQTGTRLRIEPEDRVRQNQILSDVPSGFDPEFWGVYNVIEPERSLMESIGRMKEGQLEIFD